MGRGGEAEGAVPSQGHYKAGGSYGTIPGAAERGQRHHWELQPGRDREAGAMSGRREKRPALSSSQSSSVLWVLPSDQAPENTQEGGGGA